MTFHGPLAQIIDSSGADPLVFLALLVFVGGPVTSACTAKRVLARDSGTWSFLLALLGVYVGGCASAAVGKLLEAGFWNLVRMFLVGAAAGSLVAALVCGALRRDS